MKCVYGEGCKLCKKVVHPIVKKQCHDYQLFGKCEKQNTCEYSHEGQPILKCIYEGKCRICTRNQCHDYQLNKCTKKDCKKSHEGNPTGKCIYGGVACMKCNRTCHKYQFGRCRAKNCVFTHQGPPLYKCPFNKIHCFYCNFRRENNIPCHYYHCNNGKC